MKKFILGSLTAMMLFLSSTTNAGLVGAGFAAVTFPFGMAPAFFVGFVSIEIIAPVAERYVEKMTDDSNMGFLAALGFVFLGENRQVMVFKSIAPYSASKHGLTKAEVVVYNEELARINLASDEFSKQHKGKLMTEEEAIVACNQVATNVGLSSDARRVLSKVFFNALKKII